MAIGTPVDLFHNQAATGVSSLAITTNNAVSTADLVILCHYSNNSTGNISGIIDTAGNTYVRAVIQATAPLAEFWYAKNAIAEITGSTITASFNGGTGLRHGVTALKIAGMDPLNPFDGTISNNPTGTNTSESLTYLNGSQQEGLLLSMLAGAAAFGTITWNQGFAAVGGNTATAFALPAYLIVADTVGLVHAPSWVNSVLNRALGTRWRGATPSPFLQLEPGVARKIYLPSRRVVLGPELFDVPLALAQDALTPPGIVLPNGRLTPLRCAQSGTEAIDVPLALADDALTPPGVSDARLMQRGAQRNAQRSRAEYIPNLLLSTLTPPASGSGGYGVTAGPGMSVHQGVVHSNAHGVGGNQTGNSGVEGIPHDAPQ